jgi:hypothetical protein
VENRVGLHTDECRVHLGDGAGQRAHRLINLCGCSQMSHSGLSAAVIAMPVGLERSWPWDAHCCVGAAVVGVEDGSKVGARVGVAVVGLRMRTSAGSVVPFGDS